MEKRKISEKSRLRVKPRSNSSAKFGAKKKLAVFLPLILAFTGMVVFVLLIPVSAPNLASQKTSHDLTGNFGFMQMAEDWAQGGLTMASADSAFNLTEVLEIIKSHRKFSLDRRISVRPRAMSLYQITFQSMGVTNPWQAFESEDEVRGFDLDSKKLYNMMLLEILPLVNRLPQNAILEIEGKRATRLRPDIIGQSLDIKETELIIRRAIFENRTEESLPVITAPPEIRLADTNSLGINELVAAGESDFSGSSRSRITNIRVGAEKFNGVILSPNEEFSFNDNLGPVTAAEGFKPELVIKSNGTVPELGGGLCQVSTTAFRAALYGGLEITARKNHSYAVNYYAPQGTDATIYPGVVDFKFRNDTQHHLLIATHMEENKLYFEFYGTKDDRKIAIDGPYQYDFTASGASKARLSRTVTKNGEALIDNFYSRYVSKDRYPVTYEYPKAPEVTSETTNDNQNSSDNIQTN